MKARLQMPHEWRLCIFTMSCNGMAQSMLLAVTDSCCTPWQPTQQPCKAARLQSIQLVLADIIETQAPLLHGKCTVHGTTCFLVSRLLVISALQLTSITLLLTDHFLLVPA